MRSVADQFLKKQASEGKVKTWKDLKTEMISSCLSADEGDYLMDRVEALKQGAHEDIRSYCLRFKSAVRLAYTPEQQTGLILERLIRTLIRGFVNTTIREKVIMEKHTSIDAVCNSAVEIARCLHAAHRNPPPFNYQAMQAGTSSEDVHEPMDVNMLKSSRSKPSSASDTGAHSVQEEDLVKQMRNLKVSFEPDSKSSANESPSVSKKRGRSRSPYMQDRRPSLKQGFQNRMASVENDQYEGRADRRSCNFCQRQGHFIRDCRQKLKAENRCFICHKQGHSAQFCWSNNRVKNDNYYPQANTTRRQYGRIPQSSNPVSRYRAAERGRSRERFNREKLDKKTSGADEKQQLLDDINDFYKSADNSLNTSN